MRESGILRLMDNALQRQLRERVQEARKAGATDTEIASIETQLRADQERCKGIALGVLIKRGTPPHRRP